MFIHFKADVFAPIIGSKGKQSSIKSDSTVSYIHTDVHQSPDADIS